MPGVVAILEDCPGRTGAMRAVLADLLPDHPVVVFDAAPTMLAWLGDHLHEVVLISLDHDLPLAPPGSDGGGGAGTGRDVADHLAAIEPTCPVIVHSSNNYYAPGMFHALDRAGWPCYRVYPFDDHAWVARDWADHVRRLRDSGMLFG